ncbi:MAG: hypothetical protein IPK12_15430 [Gemmatimonadetes bacterium]|nr:hypothetical protein [Gemmatimonadota bacterium]
MIATDLELFLFLLPGLLGTYAYFLYPAILRLWGACGPRARRSATPPPGRG